MTKISSLNEFRKESFKCRLKDLYCSLESEKIHTVENSEDKKKYFSKYRGKFLKLHRKNKRVTASEAAALIGFSVSNYIDLEAGNSSISDDLFFRLCYALGASNEVSIFLERIEEAIDPAKKKSRYELAMTLKNQFGIQFADPQKYQKENNHKVIPFLKK